MRFRINIPLLALNGQGAAKLTTLPAEATLQLIGPCPIGKGLVEVSWEGQPYFVFEVDLHSRAEGEL